MSNKDFVVVYKKAQNKAFLLDSKLYPNLWIMLHNMSVKYYNRAFD